MSKYIPALSIALFLSTFVYSQAQMGAIKYQKKERQAIMIYSQYPPNIVEEAIRIRMEKYGNVGNQDKTLLGKSDFIEYKNASIPEYNIRNVDMVFKVEPRSRQQKDESVIYLILLKGVDNFVTTQSDPELVEASKNLLSSGQTQIESHNLELEIGKQDEVIKKTEKQLEDIFADQVEIEKKIKALQDKLALNLKDQDLKKAEIANQKSRLDHMKGRRKS